MYERDYNYQFKRYYMRKNFDHNKKLDKIHI